MNPIDENLLRAGFAGCRTLEPSEAEVDRVLRRAVPRRLPRFAPTFRPALAVGLLAAALVAGAYAVPSTRAALERAATSVAETFNGYGSGASSDAPGRPLGPGEKAPSYFYNHDFARDPRVIAEAGGYKLYAYIAPSGSLGFDLGDTGVGMGFDSAAEISSGAVYVLGPGSMQRADAAGQVPLFGLAARSVTSIELEYESGPPLRLEGVEDGFVLLAEPGRGPSAIVARGGSDEILERRSVAYIGWDQYTR